MSNFKIITLEPKYPNVLVRRERNHTGTESVEIFTIGVYAGDEDIFSSEEIVFENHKGAQSFVKNFTTEMAIDFCVRNEMQYSKYK